MADSDRSHRNPPPDHPSTSAPFPSVESPASQAGTGSDDQEWRPEPGPGFLIGGLFLAAALLLFLLALAQVTGGEGGSRVIWTIILFIASVAIVVVTYLLVGLRRMRYILSVDKLLIITPRWTAAIPYGDVVDIVYSPRDEIELRRREPYWPGFRVAVSETREGTWHSAATASPNRRIRIRTRTGAIYAISPWRPVRFVETFTARVAARRSGGSPTVTGASEAATPYPASEPVEPHRARRRPMVVVSDQLASRFRAYRLFRDVLLRDRLMSEAVALSLATLAIMAIYTVYRSDGINLPVPARWDADGQPTFWLRPDGFWVFEGIWLYVVIGSVIFVTNVAIGTFLLIVDQFLARLIVLATPLLTFLVLLALLRVTM